MTTKIGLTALEFFNSGAETDGFELVRGEVVAMPPPGDRHGIVCANSVFLLKTYARNVGRGVVMSNDAGIITDKGPDSVRGVDVALFLSPSWAAQGDPAGYTDEPPDVAVEVRSPGQAWGALLAKVGEYLKMGIRLVWVVDPEVRRVTVFTPNSEPQVLAAENDLDGGAVLPGFRCRVADLFEGC